MFFKKNLSLGRITMNRTIHKAKKLKYISGLILAVGCGLLILAGSIGLSKNLGVIGGIAVFLIGEGMVWAATFEIIEESLEQEKEKIELEYGKISRY